jgi:hypothetical protein
MAEPKKAAPRDKGESLASQRYAVTHMAHFINNRLEPIGAIVQLPKGVKAGRYLVAVDAAGRPLKAGAAPDESAESGKKAE